MFASSRILEIKEFNEVCDEINKIKRIKFIMRLNQKELNEGNLKNQQQKLLSFEEDLSSFLVIFCHSSTKLFHFLPKIGINRCKR